MNEAGIKVMVKLEAEKAEASLKGARILLKSKLYDETVSSAYYAMFHMTKALLLTINEEPSTHHGLIILFGLNFVKPGIIEEAFNDMLIDAKESRESGDYDAARKFAEEEAAEKVENAAKFNKRISGYLKEKKYI